MGSGKGTIVSFLLQKGYEVTAIELNETFVRELNRKFPQIKVIKGDFNRISINDTFDIVTAIELIQNFDTETLYTFFEKVSRLSTSLVTNVSNRNSLHGFWTAFRGFQKSFVHTYSPTEIEKILRKIGFQVTYSKGVGILTPITLLPDFKLKIIPIWLARAINPVGEKILPRLCHLYYLEAKKI